MPTNHPHLCEPIRVGNVVFRNRMFSAPVGGAEITADCCIDRSTTAFYELRAQGGAANVTASECMVHPATDASHAFHLNTTQPGSLSGFAHTADAIMRHGAIPSLELSHSGQFAGTYLTDKSKKEGLAQFGPSDGTRTDGHPVKALTKAQIDDIVAAYGQTAALAKRVGFQMLMVHGGHGWLINQFLSPYFNKRTDEYGGSLENRARFACEVLNAVRAAVGKGFPIEFRMSGSEFFEGGYDLDEGVRIAQLLESRVDILHVSAGSYQRGFSITPPSQFRAHGCNVYLAAEIKKHVSIPVATVGGLNDPDQMEEIIASGQADIVEMARALMADPFLPRKVMAGADDEILPCLRCFVCMAERPVTATRSCAVNPVIGRELDGTEVVPVLNPKRVLVAGGGPGGLKAALTAAERGHEVILCEAEDSLGGISKGEVVLPFKREMADNARVLGLLCERAGVDIRLNTRVTPEVAREIAPDAIIVAVGSESIVPPIPGINSLHVIGATELYLRADEAKGDIAVIGGGLSGTEAAIWFGMQGHKVTLLSMETEVAPDANIRQRPILLSELEEQQVTALTQSTCTRWGGEPLLQDADAPSTPSRRPVILAPPSAPAAPMRRAARMRPSSASSATASAPSP